jgi:branched-chain amino acid transport system permease protein
MTIEQEQRVVEDEPSSATRANGRAETSRGLFLWRRTQTGTGLELPFVGAWRFVLVVMVGGLVAEAFIGATGRYHMSVFSVACAYLVGALGYNLVIGYNGQLSFGYAGFLAIGGYGFAVMQQAGHSSLVSAAVAVAAATAGGLLVGVAVLRARHFYLALITLSFAQAVILMVSRWHDQTHGDDGIAASLNERNTVYVSIAAAVVALLIVDRLVRSRFGRAMVMVRSDENVAMAMGVPSAYIRLVVSAVGGAFGGMSGVLLSGTLGFITPQNFSVELTVLLLTMIVVGGMGSIWGTVIGATVIMILNQMIADSLGWRDIIYGLVLFGALALLPGGVVNLPDRLNSLRGKLRRRGVTA